MVERQTALLHPHVFESLAASKIGMWHWDVAHDRVTCDRTNAGILGIEPGEAERGVPLQRVFDAIHPDDRTLFREMTAPARERGGSVTLEVRTIPAPDVVRRVVLRGRYEADPGGRMVRGTGVLIDLTDIDARSLRAPSEDIDQSALDRLVDHAIAVHRAAEDLGDLADTPIRLLTGMLLLEIGRHVAGPPRRLQPRAL